MAPKDDPETAALKKELADLIAKFQVDNFHYEFSFHFFFEIFKIQKLFKV